MKNKETFLLQAYIVLTSLLLIVRDVGGVGMNKYNFLIISFIFFAISSVKTMTYMLMFTFPLFCGLPAAHIRLAAILLYVLKKRLNFGQFFFSVFVIVWECMAAIWYPVVNTNDILGYLSAPVMLFLLLWDRDEDSEIDYKKCIYLFMWGFALVCFILFSGGLASHSSLLTVSQGLFRHSLTDIEKNVEGVVIKMNANTFAYFCCVCASLSTCLALDKKARGIKNVATNYLCAVIFTVLGLLTISRSFIVLMPLLFFMFSISSLKNISSIFPVLFIYIFMIALVYAVILLTPSLYETIFNRFAAENTETAGGREDLFIEYMNIFLNNERIRWIGTGVVEYTTICDMTRAIHNGFQQLIICLGIPGSIVFVLGIILPFRAFLIKDKVPYFYYIPFLSVILFTQTIQFLNPTIIMFPLIAVFFALKMHDKEIKKMQLS